MTIGDQVVHIISKRHDGYDSSDRTLRRLATRLYRRVQGILQRRARAGLIREPDQARAERRQHHRWNDHSWCRRCGISAKQAHARGLDCRMVRVRAGNAARKARRGWR